MELFLRPDPRMLALDLGVFHRRRTASACARRSSGASYGRSSRWRSTLWIYYRFGSRIGLEFLTGYLIEKSLSRRQHLRLRRHLLGYFAVPGAATSTGCSSGASSARWSCARRIHLRRRGAARRASTGSSTSSARFLVFTGIKLSCSRTRRCTRRATRCCGSFRRFLPVDRRLRRRPLLRPARTAGCLATPLLLVLVLVEVDRLVFALDSIPAIFAVTRDPFIVFTSNIFAILGLRSLFFLLAGVMDKFHYLKVGLGAGARLRRRQDAARTTGSRSPSRSRSPSSWGSSPPPSSSPCCARALPRAR